MKPEERETAIELMMRFAERTGLTSQTPTRRYLWTDAFAVCNFLELGRLKGDERYRSLALQLVDQVHHVLGSHRTDDSRTGWISGLGEDEGEAHPTRGGLRIGKALPERGASEPLERELEWNRDGQYFHYLTKWMHALHQVSRSTGQARCRTWARELAEVSHEAFTYEGRRGMFWKMSIDLTRPLVPSMGHHDPLDGFITCVQLQTTTPALSSGSSEPSLQAAVADFAAMVEGGEWTTTDPLGLGGLLTDAARVAQLMRRGAFAGSDLLTILLNAAERGLSHYARYTDTREPGQRLAFRELGLAIGLSGLELIEKVGDPRYAELRELIEALSRHVELGSNIKAFWLDPGHRQARTWSEHRDINDVMLATSLVPAGFLVL